MIKYLPRISFFVLTLFLIFCTPAWSTTVQSNALQHQFLQSALVAEVTCLEVTEEASAPYYRVVWQATDIFKGHSIGTKLTTRIPGGHINSYNVYVPGHMAPHVGDRAIIFLTEPDRKGLRWLFGGNQGLFAIKRLQGQEVVTLSGQTVSLKRFRQQLHEFRIKQPVGP
ncbi:MAG: hypothetical protein IMF11_07525 [Proteobacteria bacterium]|nr:hypothetical protein [Pseudomonadota bacterium]